MNQPLPYFVFVAGVIAAVVCFVALLFAAYRKSGKLRDMARFVVSPEEYSTPDLRLRSVLMKFFASEPQVPCEYHCGTHKDMV